jgi:hypothetical protein
MILHRTPGRNEAVKKVPPPGATFKRAEVATYASE